MRPVTIAADQETIAARERVRELADSQIDNYQRQPEELISHFNREVSALDGYRGRQLLELLQNADDAGVDTETRCRLLLNISRTRLIVANTGKPFSKKGLTSLVISDCSPKQLDRNRFIGCKGLGFRSILTWTDRPLISSGPYEVFFDRERAVGISGRLANEFSAVDEIASPFRESTGRWPAAVMRFPALPVEDDPWLAVARTCRAEGYDTVVVLPLPDGPRGDEIHREMLDQISGLPTSSLLFCRHLTRVEVTGDLQRTWDFLREDHGDGHTTVMLEPNGIPERWQVYRRTGQVAEEAAAMSSGGRRDFEVAVAVPEAAKADAGGSLCVFFPTHERLPCCLVMHATLETTDDRNRLVTHTSNREVLRHLASHVAEVVEREAAEATPRRALELLTGIENADPELKALGFVDSLVGACAARSIFPRLDGTLRPPAEVRQAPHGTWLSLLSANVFPEVLAIGPADPLCGLLRLFHLAWFDSATLKDRMKSYLLRVSRGKAGEILGSLLAAGQLASVGAGGLLIGTDGNLIGGGDCFFTPVERLPTLPAWASSVRFVDEAFQAGLIRGSRAMGLRFLASDLSRCGGDVDEYRFDTVSRALIEQVEIRSPEESDTAKQRWRELLRWLFDASPGSRQMLPNLAIKVVTKRGALRRATNCYLGPDYPRGQVIWRLYRQFEQDEFIDSPIGCGLGGVPVADAEDFLFAIGVSASPRFETLRSGSEYRNLVRTIVERIDYPRTIRDRMCHSAAELRAWCTRHNIEGLRLPDRWVQLLTEGDTAALVAFLLSSGATYLAENTDSQAKFQATVGSERTNRTDASVPIPNSMLLYLRDKAWVPATDGKRRRPSEIILSSQGVRVLRGVYVRHAIDAKDPLILTHGGREALESLLTRLGAVSSLETLTGQSLYELLQALPRRDPSGQVAPGIYRTLIESGVSVDDSSHREKFLRSGRMWGRYNGIDSYLPVMQLRYNANLTVTTAIEAHIPLVDIPRRMNTALVKQLFGIQSLTAEQIQLALVAEGTEYDPGSEDANLHLRSAVPYIYALRLARNLDDRGRELNLLRKATLRICSRAHVSARLPDGSTEDIILNDVGKRIVVDTTLIIVDEYRESDSGFLTFWLGAAELVAELLGRDVADEFGGVLRCRSTAEMLEVVRVRLGREADAKLAEARSRFEDLITDDEDKENPIPPPKVTAPTPESSANPSAPVLAPPKSVGGYETVGDADPGSKTTFNPVAAPADRPTKKHKLIVVGPGRGGSRTFGPLATEAVTFKVVGAFERAEGRFIVRVDHLRGSDSFGCDLLSVGSEAVRDKAMAEQSIVEAEILRHIEVKGRSSRAGAVELEGNEYRAAKRLADRYWVYRVFVDPKREGHFEVAVLSDPLNSKAVRTITKFDLAEGSGASWYSMVEEVD